MYKYLFFDDQKLWRRNGLVRKMGHPRPIADSVYFDGHCTTDWPTPHVFRMDDGKYRMIYEGSEKDGSMHCFIAVSEDGIHFEPQDVTSEIFLENRVAVNEIMPLGYGTELAAMIEDNVNDPSERYKLLITRDHNSITVGDLYVSADLVHWTLVEGVNWNRSKTEPVVGCFYNKHHECFTITLRPYCGDRRVGYVETKDWRTYTSHELCLQTDSLDEPLDEIYGMPAFEYEGRYIGFPLVYHGFKVMLHSKFWGGTMKPQLAYSWDGRHWQRTLREPFMDGVCKECEEAYGWNNYMLWPMSMLQTEEGNLRIYAGASGYEHGDSFRIWGKGRIGAWELRKDGFMALTTESPEKAGLLNTRENIWHSGELHVNLQAAKATMAVYETYDDETGRELLRQLEGYNHEDCIPFTGDSTDWVPCFKSGKTLDELSGKTVALEIKLEDGSVYSMTADCTPLMNWQGIHYRLYDGMTPERVM